MIVEILNSSYTYYRDSIAIIYSAPGGGGEDEPSGYPRVVSPVPHSLILLAGDGRTLPFQVVNASSDSVYFNGVISCTDVVTTCQVGGSATFETEFLAPGQSQTLSLTLGTNTTPGSGAFRIIVSGTGADTVNVAVTSQRDSLLSLVVTKPIPTLNLSAGTPDSLWFHVSNPDPYATRYVAMSTSCTLVTACAVSPTNVLLAPGRDTVVRATFTAGAAIGKLRVQASAGDGSPDGLDSTSIKPSGDPGTEITVTALEPRPRSSVARGECLSIAAGPGAGVECGALRMAYAFPSLRTMNRERTLRLLYLAQHAQPVLTIPVKVVIDRRPDAVNLKTTLTVGAASMVKTFTWNPACASAAGCVVNVPFNADSLNLATGDYAYTLQVELADDAAINGSVAGTAVVVNRKSSLFGSGWWLEGVETLMPALGNSAHRLWIGGDGSARLYIATADSIFVPKDSVDRPDTLRRVGSGPSTTWVRHTRNGGRVTFDNLYRHITTTNREGHVTTFAYSTSTSTRLMSISLPVMSTTPVKYEFTYDSTGGAAVRLRTVRAPWTASVNHDVTLTMDADRRVLVIKEPSTDSIRFTYSGASRLMASRIDRMGQSVDYTHTAAGHLTQFLTMHRYTRKAKFADTLVPDSTALTTRLCTVEGRTLSMCAIDSTAAAAIPSTRFASLVTPDGGTASRVWRYEPAPFGAVARMRDPIGATTTLTREATGFPALVTKVVDPMGVETIRAFNSRGLPDSTLVLNAWNGSSVDVTLHTWHAHWDMMTEERDPTGVITRFGIDSATGNRTWQQRGTNDSTRTTIVYDAQNRPLTVTTDTLLQGTYEYDAVFGNLQTAITARGHRTRYFPNRAGAVDSVKSTLSETTCEAADSTCLRQKFVYDNARRVTSDTTIAPAWNWSLNPIESDALTGTSPAMKAVVTTTYDKEGRQLTVTRSTPGAEYANATAVSTYVYDNVGRPWLSSTNGSAVDTTQYDAAGNVYRIRTRTGREILQGHDRLGRLVWRTTPEVRYAKTVCTTCHAGQINVDSVRVPYYRTPVATGVATPDVLIPLETSVFAYDVVGRMIQADNQSALVRRTYFPGGALQSDTTLLRQYSSPSDNPAWSSAYGMAFGFEYDIAGRRTARTDGWGGRQTYSYDALGQLVSTRDSVSVDTLTGRVQVNFSYDQFGRLREQTVSGTGYSELFHYDNDGRVIEREGVMNETIAYDIRGKRTVVAGPLQYNGAPAIRMEAAYDGFGHLVATATSGAVYTTDEYEVDGFGNQHRRQRNRDQALTPIPETVEEYTFSSGRLSSSTGVAHPDTTGREGPLHGPPVQAYDEVALQYDAAGNVTYQTSFRWVWDTESLDTFEQPVGGHKYTWTFYDANDKPRFVQQRIRPDSGAARTEYSEYWYDALGRRVLVREYGDSASGAGTITRFAWEGDQLLKEFRIAAGYAVGSLEGLGSGSWYGTRRYTQTGVIDQPLVLWLDDAAPRVVVRNWRGSAAGAMMVGGGGPDTLIYPAAMVDVQYAPDALMGAVTPTAWLGSLIAEQADATGLLYRRNRYYDPQTGRFTQEDPMGLAAGMNLYGYADGDPVNRSDPFGLRDIEVQGENSTRIVAYLLEHSETFREAYNRLDNDRSVQLTIRDANDPLRAGVGRNSFTLGADGKSGTILFNDVGLNQANFDLFSKDPGSNWMFTAASVMGHEMGHANAFLGSGPAGCKSDSPPGCILMFENQIRSELPANARGGTRTRYSTDPGKP